MPLAGTQEDAGAPGVGVVPDVGEPVPGGTVLQRPGPLPFPPRSIQANVAATPESASNPSKVMTMTPPVTAIKVLPEQCIRCPPSRATWLQQRQQTWRHICHHRSCPLGGPGYSS